MELWLHLEGLQEPLALVPGQSAQRVWELADLSEGPQGSLQPSGTPSKYIPSPPTTQHPSAFSLVPPTAPSHPDHDDGLLTAFPAAPSLVIV